MKIRVVRNRSTDEGTPGALCVLDTMLIVCSLELPWRNNLRGESCIVADTYMCDIWYSPTLKREVLRLEDKHGRRDCLIHNANFAGYDNPLTPEHEITQVHGCTAVGDRFGQIKKPNSDETQFGVMNSVATLEKLLGTLGPGPHWITYEWASGSEPFDLRDLNQ